MSGHSVDPVEVVVGHSGQPGIYAAEQSTSLAAGLRYAIGAEVTRRAKLKMKFPTPNYAGKKTEPRFIVVMANIRYVDAFPVLNDGSEPDTMYRKNAERMLLQSVAAATMAGHLAAAALGHAVWWVTAIGQEET